jgi:hypothetical protein
MIIMFRVRLAKGYTEIEFIFKTMQDACDFMAVALHNAEEKITATVQVVEKEGDK